MRRIAHGAALAAIALALACGKRGDPQPPLPRTPQAVQNLSVGQRGGDLVIRYLAPRTTTGGVRLDVHEVEVLTTGAEGDFLKTALVEAHRTAPGETVSLTRALPPPGTKLRVAARARVGRDRSALTSVVTFLTQPPPPAPTALTARLTPDGVALAWTGTIPSPPPPPPPSPAPSPSASPSPGAAPSAVPSAPPSPPRGALAAAIPRPSPAAPASLPAPGAPAFAPGFRVYVGSSRVDLQACKLEYSIVSPK